MTETTTDDAGDEFETGLGVLRWEPSYTNSDGQAAVLMGRMPNDPNDAYYDVSYWTPETAANAKQLTGKTIPGVDAGRSGWSVVQVRNSDGDRGTSRSPYLYTERWEAQYAAEQYCLHGEPWQANSEALAPIAAILERLGARVMHID